MPGRQFYSPMLLSSDQYSTFFWHAQLVTYKIPRRTSWQSWVFRLYFGKRLPENVFQSLWCEIISFRR